MTDDAFAGIDATMKALKLVMLDLIAEVDGLKARLRAAEGLLGLERIAREARDQ